MESNFQHVEDIISTLAKDNITIKLTRSYILTKILRYLGHIIEPEKLSIDDTTVNLLKEANPRVINMNWVIYLVYVTFIVV